MTDPKIIAYILAKNEADNVGKCLDRLAKCGISTIVLDSGSSDNTIEVASSRPNVIVENYRYTTHADAYNWIIGERTGPNEWAMILDCDMEVTEELWAELKERMANTRAAVLIAPILMYCEGKPLHYGSLCPPKAMTFRGGRHLFEGRGHGESIIQGTDVEYCRSFLIHDDRKPYSQYLLTQLRYANSLNARSRNGKLSWRDRVRLRSPLLAILVPAYSYFFRLGFRSGKAGVVYAIDRVVAEILQFRQAIVSNMDTGSTSQSDTKNSQFKSTIDQSERNNES